jgi:hypothetical protein
VSRVQERKGFEVPVRVTLLEGDADKGEDALEGFRLELRGIRNVLVGLLVSVSTAAILLAINLVARS